jgi:hypothetical protein
VGGKIVVGKFVEEQRPTFMDRRAAHAAKRAK